MATLEQLFCWFIALVLFVVAFRYLTKEKLSLSFVLCLCAIGFAFFGLSGVQGLLKTGLLVTVKDSLIKYGDKLEGFQTNVMAVREELIKQQAQIQKQQTEIESQQNKIHQAQADVSSQQINITNQSERILSLQSVLASAQSNVNTIAAEMVKQQTTIDNHQKELESQQAVIRKAQNDVAIQQAGLTTQFDKMFQLQTDVAIAETNISKQQRKIEDIESLINGFYARSVVESFPITDSSRVTAHSDHWNHTVIMFKLKSVPVPNSIQATVQTHLGVVRGFLGLFVGSPFSTEMPISVGSNRNIAYCSISAPKWDIPEYPRNAVFILRYTKSQDTNIFSKVQVKGKNVFFDNVPQVFK
jgi:hypothetical protein